MPRPKETHFNFTEARIAELPFADKGDRYKYMPELAPTLDLLTKIKNGTINWAEYEQTFNDILKKRQIENLFAPNTINKVCFLCAEKTAENCHRRLVAEYLQQHFPDIEIVHL